MSDEAPTPRLTGTWQVWATAASELSDQLRELELRESKDWAKGDRARAQLARQTRHVAEAFARGFYAWTTAHVEILEKQRQRREFQLFNTFARELLK